MPQMSPMSWMAISISPFILTQIMSTNDNKVNKKSDQSKKLSMKNKKWSW